MIKNNFKDINLYDKAIKKDGNSFLEGMIVEVNDYPLAMNGVRIRWAYPIGRSISYEYELLYYGHDETDHVIVFDDEKDALQIKLKLS
jgi:hypothetical protein